MMVGVILCAVVAMVYFTGNGRTETYKKELRAKGELIYWSDWTPHSTNGNPGYIRLLKDVGKFRTNEFSPNALTVMEYTSPEHARVAWISPMLFDDGDGHTYPEAAFFRQMKTNAAALAELHEALMDPEPDLGFAETNTRPRLSSKLFAFRFAAKSLACATINELHSGNLIAAVSRLQDLANLSRVHRDNPNLVSQMTGIAVADLGFGVTWEALQAPGWEDAQLRQLQHNWEQLNLLTALEKGCVGDRLLGIEKFEAERYSGTNNSQYRPKSELVIGLRLATSENDELFFLKSFQRQIEHVRLLTNGTPWVKVFPLLKNDHAEFKQTAGPQPIFLHFYSSLFMTDFTHAAQTTARYETDRRLTIIAIALKRHQLRHQTLPPTLAALVPEFLTAVPIDCMDGKPLRYQPKPDGTFLLYSVGEDGIDNGGDPTRANPKLAQMDLWSGRDAVWPVGVMEESK